MHRIFHLIQVDIHSVLAYQNFEDFEKKVVLNFEEIERNPIINFEEIGIYVEIPVKVVPFAPDFP